MGPQCKRVLRALRRYPQGICQADFHPPNIIDGGPMISRLAARIRDLKDEGHEIDVDGERLGFAVYKLRVEVPASPVDATGAPSTPSAGGGLDPEPTLFHLPRKPSSPYDEAA